MTAFLNKKPNILLLHEAPDYPGQSCPGNPFIREKLENVRFPLLAMWGHVEWQPIMVSLSEQVTVLNVHERVIILLYSHETMV